MHPLRPDNDAAAGVLVREFDAGAVAELRKAVLGYATACGMPEDRAIDVMFAVHELAANAVCHGPGHGRVKLHVAAGNLHCEVSDPGTFSRAGGAGPQSPGAPGPIAWPVEQSHGLWLVHATADHVRMTSGPHGSLITAVFTLPTAAMALGSLEPGKLARHDRQGHQRSLVEECRHLLCRRRDLGGFGW